MDLSHGASHLAAASLSPVQVAKAALRRLALDKVEPTPENYARAYAAEGGPCAETLPERARPLLQRLAAPLAHDAAGADTLVRALMAGQWAAADDLLEQAATQSLGQAQDWCDLFQRLAHGLERGSRLWTAARKKDSLTRVLCGSRSDPRRLRERVRQRHAAGTDASEADVAVLQGQLAHRDALTDEEASHALRIDTRAPVDWAAWSSALPSSE